MTFTVLVCVGSHIFFIVHHKVSIGFGMSRLNDTSFFIVNFIGMPTPITVRGMHCGALQLVGM